MLSLLAVLALSACGAVSPMDASPVSTDAPKVQGGVKGQCEMRVEVDPAASLLHAVYDTPELCGGEVPRWVLTGFGDPDHLDMEVMNYPAGRRLGSNQGWYMRPLAPLGGPYEMQARSGYNNGRVSFLLTINADGSVLVVMQ